MDKLNIGQILTIKEDLKLESFFGESKIIKKGTQAFVGADKMVHYLNGTIQPIKEEIVGFSVEGIAEWVYHWMSMNLPLDDCLNDYDITKEDFKRELAGALQDLGMWNNKGNRG